MTDTTARDTHLRGILLARRGEVQEDVQRRIRDGRTDRPIDVRDEMEHCDGDICKDVEFALLQMKAETLRRVEEALGQLDAGTYGRCFQCGVEISETRLLALPFAVRCKTCEERREQVHAQTQRRAEQHSSFLSLSDMG